MSRIRQNYREETEALVNQQINIQLTASYAYQVGSSYIWHMAMYVCLSSFISTVYKFKVHNFTEPKILV